jgi:hypothetical protein
LTADIYGLSSGGSTAAANLNGLPSFPVTFNNAVQGSLSGVGTQLVKGAATATFTPDSSGIAGTADAKTDNQTITSSAMSVATAFNSVASTAWETASTWNPQCVPGSMVKWIERIEFIETEKVLGKREGGKNEDDEYFDLLPNI